MIKLSKPLLRFYLSKLLRKKWDEILGNEINPIPLTWDET